MKVEKIKRAGPAMLALLSFFLFAIAFLCNQRWLIFICFIPFFRALSLCKTAQTSFIIGYFYGMLTFGLAFFWLTNVYWPIYVVAFLFEAVYLGLFATGFFSLNKARKLIDAVLCACLWVVIEFVRSQGYLGMPVGLAGYSLTSYLPLAQIASIGGIYLLSFYVVGINLLLYYSVQRDRRSSSRALIFFIVLALIAGNALFGKNILSQASRPPRIKIALVQGNIPPDRKWDPAFLQESISIHENLSLETLKENPSLIVWPETAVSCFLFHPERRFVLEEMIRFSKRIHCPLLFGTQDFWVDEKGKHVYNLALLFDQNGKDLGRYAKMKLIPFVEKPPFRAMIPFLRRHGVSSIYDPGDEHTVFSLNGIKFSTVICFEGLFPDSVRRFAQEGAQFLVNITNDAPSLGAMEFFYEHNVEMLMIRSIENRKSLVRAANNGISLFIDPQGRVIKKSRPFGAETITAEIPLNDELTFYTRYGNWLISLCGSIILVHAIFKIFINLRIKNE